MDNIKRQEAITEIKKLTEPIFKEYGVEKAYIFGSYARGDYNENSDIDIIISSKSIRSLLIIGAILEALKLVLKKEVDLIEEECFENEEKDEIDQDFYNRIKKERILMVRCQTHTGRLRERGRLVRPAPYAHFITETQSL